MRRNWVVIVTGIVVGFLGVYLTRIGNPPNMGFCIACFIRDIAGALSLHGATPVQYIRPEIAGIVLGSFVVAALTREFRPRGGSSTVTRFVLGIALMVGALVFLGCPLRMILRLAAGDLNALAGLAGFAVGIAVGTWFLANGFTLGRSCPQATGSGLIAPAFFLFALILLLLHPAFIHFSAKGPGSMHAPIAMSLIAGATVGVLAQRSRLCMAGGIRDLVLLRDPHLISGFTALLAVALLSNLAFGSFSLGFQNQPIAHTDGIWNFLGMLLVGLCSVTLGGCPLRQLVMAGEGDSDSAITVFGMIAGAALSHNFGLAAGPQGVPVNGKWAVLMCLLLVFAIIVSSTERFVVARKEAGAVDKGSAAVQR